MQMPTSFGARLRGWRMHRGRSQLDLAGAVGTPQRHVSFLTSNLPPGASATRNAKTACSAAGRSGTVRTEAMTQHRHTWTLVWQTQVTNALGHLLRRLVQTLRV